MEIFKGDDGMKYVLQTADAKDKIFRDLLAGNTERVEDVFTEVFSIIDEGTYVDKTYGFSWELFTGDEIFTTTSTT